MRSIVPSKRPALGLLKVHLHQSASHLASNLCFLLAMVIENPSSEATAVTGTFTTTTTTIAIVNVNSRAMNYLTWRQKLGWA